MIPLGRVPWFEDLEGDRVPDELAAGSDIGQVAGCHHLGNEVATGGRFGWSGVDWTVGPDMPDASLTISDGNLTLQGECKGWV